MFGECFLVFSDPFLPRVCELASSSSDRQTKVYIIDTREIASVIWWYGCFIVVSCADCCM